MPGLRNLETQMREHLAMLVPPQVRDGMNAEQIALVQQRRASIKAQREDVEAELAKLQDAPADAIRPGE